MAIVNGLSFLVLLLFSLTLFAEIESVAIVDNLVAPKKLGHYIEIIEDPSHEFTFDDIKNGKYDHLWIGYSDRKFIGGDVTSKYWFRVAVRWDGLDDRKGILYFDTLPSLMSRLTVAVPVKEEGVYADYKTGHVERFDSRAMPSFQFAFPLHLMPGETSIILGSASNIESAVPVQLPLYITSESNFDSQNAGYFVIVIAYYSLVLALIIYNGCLFATLRSPTYGLYIIFLCGAAFSCAALDGTAARYILPSSPDTMLRINAVFGVITTTAYLLFIATALEGLLNWKYSKKILLWGLSLGGISLVYNLLSTNFMAISIVLQVYGGLVTFFTLFIVVRAVQKKVPTSGYIFVASITTIVGAFCFLLTIQNVIPLNPITKWSIHWGFGSEALLLSLALAARTRMATQTAIDNLQKYEALYEGAIEGLFKYDIVSTELRCNVAFAKTFGYDSSHIMPKNKSIFSYFPSEVQYDLRKKLAACSSIRGYEVEIDTIDANDNNWILVTIQSVYDEQGGLSGYEGSITDITQKKLKERAEREKDLSYAQNKAKSQFFASMSHEFRTPLTAILGYADIASQAHVTESERKEYFSTVKHSANHMLQIINDVLDISKIEAQQMDMEIVSVNTQEISRCIYDVIWILAKQKGVKFAIEYEFPLPKLFYSDPTRLKQALINLCSNAVKFTKEGNVTLRISFDDKTKKLIFSVKDTGIGIKPDQLQKLFKAFAQAHSGVTRDFGGTGLGLHLSKMIASKLGGDIAVESEYGQGSVFTLTVAAGDLSDVEFIEEIDSDCDTEFEDDFYDVDTNGVVETEGMIVNNNATSTERVSPTEEQGACIRVLLVEDNAINQELVGLYLEQAEVEFVVANDGLEAIAEILKGDFHLVLMDMEMPHMNGMTAVRALRSKGYGRPIYALTANYTTEAINECKEAGCEGHLTKPVDVDKLMSVVVSAKINSNNTSDPSSLSLSSVLPASERKSDHRFH